MAESGRSCKPKGRRTREAESYDLKAVHDAIHVERGGRLVRTLVGRDADEVRRALEAGDADELQRIVARKVRT